MKKIISLLLFVCVLCSVASLGTITSYAAETVVSTEAELLDAIANSADGDKITFVNDITVNGSITLDKALHFYLGDCKLQVNGDVDVQKETHIYCSNYGNVIVTGLINTALFNYNGELGTVTYDPATGNIYEDPKGGSNGIHFYHPDDILLPDFPAKDITGNCGADAPELTYAMRFENPTQFSYVQAAYYAGWYPDFVINISNTSDDSQPIIFKESGGKIAEGADAYLAGAYGGFEAYPGGWLTVPPSAVQYVPNRDGNYLILGSGFNWTVMDVFGRVGAFYSGIKLSDEFLAENPNVKVSVELHLYPNNSKSGESKRAAGETFVQTPTPTPTPSPTPTPAPVPLTDDNSNAALWTVLFVGFVALAVFSRKRKNA